MLILPLPHYPSFLPNSSITAGIRVSFQRPRPTSISSLISICLQNMSYFVVCCSASKSRLTLCKLRPHGPTIRSSFPPSKVNCSIDLSVIRYLEETFFLNISPRFLFFFFNRLFPFIFKGL